MQFLTYKSYIVYASDLALSLVEEVIMHNAVMKTQAE